MTAYTDFATFLARMDAPWQRVSDNKSSITALAGRLFSSWLATGGNSGTGAAPTTAAVPSRTIAGALGQIDPVVSMRIAHTAINRNAPSYMLLCDRLSHQGGLSGTTTGAQTTNLPTAALTRYTSGEGVMAGIEIYSAIGGSATTFTSSYTNQAGTSSRTSEVSNIGGANYQTASRMLLLPLQKGDSGVRAVASVTLAATTGTAGNFGVTLFKPLLAIPFPSYSNASIDFNGFLNLGGQLPEILPDACLFWTFVAAGSFGGQSYATLTMTDDSVD